MIVGYLTIAFDKNVNPKVARHIIDEIAGEAISYEAVDAVKCDLGEMDGKQEIEFWDEAAAS